MRTLSPDAVAAIFAQESKWIFTPLLRIDHESLSRPIRIYSGEYEPYVEVYIPGDSEPYKAFPFQVNIPEDLAENIPQAQLTISNVSYELIQILRSVTEPPKISLYVVRWDATYNPNDSSLPPMELGIINAVVEIGPLELFVREFSYTDETLTLSLGQDDDYLNSPAVKDTFNVQVAPGLFKRI